LTILWQKYPHKRKLVERVLTALLESSKTVKHDSSGGGTDEFQEKEDPFQTHCSLSAHVCCFALSVHAALVIGNEFGFGTYVGYWKSQADTVAPLVI